MPTYTKKDEEHDVLGNKINPDKLFLPDDLFRIITIGKRKFYVIKDVLQCAMCLEVMYTLAEPKEDAKNGIRRLYTLDQCACNRAKM